MSIDQNGLKQQAAEAALSFIQPDTVIGVGTGSTVNYFIEALSSLKNKIKGAVASSKVTAEKLKAIGIEVLELNSVDEIAVYVDGADEINDHFQMIKGGGGALTGEKIVATVSKKIICIADETKKVSVLGKFPVAVEVIPLARSFVARECVKLGGMPEYRQHFVTDYGNVILDVHHLDLTNPLALEEKLNQIPGVVTNGIFAKRPADVLLLATQNGVKTLENC